jgi:hypothetical protein
MTGIMAVLKIQEWIYLGVKCFYSPFQGKINVASLGPRALQKRIKSSGFSRTVDVQVSRASDLVFLHHYFNSKKLINIVV